MNNKIRDTKAEKQPCPFGQKINRTGEPRIVDLPEHETWLPKSADTGNCFHCPHFYSYTHNREYVRCVGQTPYERLRDAVTKEALWFFSGVISAPFCAVGLICGVVVVSFRCGFTAMVEFYAKLSRLK